MRITRTCGMAALGLMLLAMALAPAACAQKAVAAKKSPDVIFVPTPQEAVDAMLNLAEVSANDTVYDLGCGDGRIVVTAAKKYGAKARGFDIDPNRIRESQENIQKNKVENLASVSEADIFQLDLKDATVVTLYLLPSLNVKLLPQLEKLKPGTRIVSHDFDMKGIKPEKVIRVKGPSRDHTVYLWRTPLVRETAAKSSTKTGDKATQ